MQDTKREKYNLETFLSIKLEIQGYVLFDTTFHCQDSLYCYILITYITRERTKLYSIQLNKHYIKDL